MTTFISFYPKHDAFGENEHEAQISTYRAWLDKYGNYGKLYMLNQGPAWEGCAFREKGRTIINGLNIYDEEIAVLFKLVFEI